MAGSRWIRKWTSKNSEEDPASALVRAAVRDESLDLLLDLGVRSLLVAAAADRVGLWLVGNGRGESDRGQVLEANPGPIPIQWKHLDSSTPCLREALQGEDFYFEDIGAGGKATDVGPLVGMHSAIWIPLRTRNLTVGLAMVAYARPSMPADPEILRTCAHEITLAIRHHRDSRRNELASDELRARVRLSRAISSGVSTESILLQIARAARRYLRAEFVAIGQGCAPPISGLGLDGSTGWANAIYQGPLFQLWVQTFNEGHEFEIPGHSVPVPSAISSHASNRPLDRVLAIPIEVRNRICGVLMAGVAPAEDSIDDLARLESYGLLAATAIDRDFAQQERLESKRALRRVIEDSGECLVLIDAKGIVRQTSRPGAALLFPLRGRSDETRLEEFFPATVRGEVTRWRRRLTSQEHATIPGTETPLVSLEVPLYSGGVVRLYPGSERIGFGDAAPYWLIHFEDQGAQQEPQNGHDALELEMAALLDSIESGVLLVDASGKIRMVSDRLGAILGFEARRLRELGTIDALISTVSHHFTRPVETAARWHDHIHRGADARWDEFELSRPSHRIVERFARPLYKPHGNRLGWLEVYRDITGQRLIQSKLLQTEKMAALGQLVSGIAHELNNPLTSIQGYAQLLLSRQSVLDRNGDAQRISQEAERAGRIVKNLLLFSRETKPERRAVSLNEVIERTLSLRSYELKLENIGVELILDSMLPHTLADAAQLQQVIFNLILNAEQAIVQGRGQEGRGEEGRSGQIQIRTRRLPGDRICMEVTDDGPGIAPAVVSRIFDPFFTTKAAGMGTGLGLSIVYGIIQEHGGEVTVESQVGRGATLTVELPVLSVEGLDFAGDGTAKAACMPVVSLPARELRPRTHPERILVVEDEPTVAELIADVMTEEGHRVDTLLDSREALGKLEETDYALVICDLKMPHLDGPELFRALVRRSSPARRKILFVTGDTMSPRTLDFLNSNGLPYLAKPFLVEELKEAVREVLAAGSIDENSADSESRAVTRVK